MLTVSAMDLVGTFRQPGELAFLPPGSAIRAADES
jgi:hypothetical protein